MKTFWVVTSKYENGKLKSLQTKVIKTTECRPANLHMQGDKISIRVSYFVSEEEAEMFIKSHRRLSLADKKELADLLGLFSCMVLILVCLMTRSVHIPMMIVTLICATITGHYEKLYFNQRKRRQK